MDEKLEENSSDVRGYLRTLKLSFIVTEKGDR